MEWDKKWYLIRLGDQSSIYQLKNGITSIGRNKKADVITISDICSRRHCTITWDTNELTLTNLSDNGTYVNEDRVNECKLKEGDKIGLGCDFTILTLNVPHPEKYYVFEVVRNLAPNADVIVSDEEDEMEIVSDSLAIHNNNIVAATNHEGQNENEEHNVLSTNGSANQISQSNISDTNERSSKSNRDINSTSNNDILDSSKLSTAIESNCNKQATNKPPILNISDGEDENEFHFSQQCMMQIKQEVNDSDKAPNLNDDFQIQHAADDDDDYIIHDESFSNWCGRLSQDQDYAIKKVQQSSENNKRKAAKLIEAVPEKKRKHSHGKDKIPKTKQSHTNAANKIANNEQVEIIMTVNTCEDSVDRLTVKEANFLVPFAEIPNTIAQQRKKIRIAHRPKTSAYSIPSTSNSATDGESSMTKQQKKKKSVRFADDDGGRLSTYHYFQAKKYEDNEILIAPAVRPPIQSNKPNETNETENSFENDPLHEIITDITEWRTDWIAKQLNSPPLNDVRSIVPVMDVYIDFQNYKEVLIPLLKHELWSSIVADTSKRSRSCITIDDRSLTKRANRKRYIFNAHVNMESNSPKVFVGDFVLIESNNCPSFFAYVTGHQFIRNCRITYFTMEASETAVKFTNTQSTSFYATPITNIRSELKQFSAILYLEKTPFKDMIINPIKNPLTDPKVQIEGFKYTGYDELNANQLEILKKIQTKCSLGDYNLSLIEGPPGTGKTRLITGIILQLLFGKNIPNKLRILVLTSSNAAVDIIARKLIHIKNKMEDGKKKNMLNIVRYGVLNSMHPEVQCIAPQNLQKNLLAAPQMASDQVKNLRMQRDHLTKRIESESEKNTRNNSNIADIIDELRKRLTHINSLIQEYTGQQHPDDIKIIMRDARVVCSTLSSAINIKPFVKTFDVCIIDEASQCTESWSMVPLQYQITSFILVGDSKQLSPVVLSQVCRDNGMERSLFTRLFDSTSDNKLNKYSLTTQYRMHLEICSFPNKYFYGHRLRCAEETNCDSFKLEPYTVISLDFKQSNEDAINYHNSGEAQFIVDLLKVLEKLASPLIFSYGLITPYAKQKAEIQQYIQRSKTLSGYDFPVNTIDSYQGQEKDIIILSTARTTGVGFLANPQRLNVALTRAKKCLIICGNFTSVANIRVWKELLKDAKERNKLYAIPNKYDFEMIANIIKKNQSHAVKPQKPNQ